jgi:hypothetical protein
MSALGLTPADRLRPSVPPQKPQNRFDDLANKTEDVGERPN